MPINLTDFVLNETGYVTKLNANNQAVRDYVDETEQANNSIASSAISIGSMQTALFGTAPAVFGEASYRTIAIGSDLIVSPGIAWAPSQGLIVRLLGGATVSMTGFPSGTYYLNGVNGDPLTVPVISNIQRDPLYSFTWNGSSITNLTRLASVFQPLVRGAERVAYASTLLLDWSKSDTLRVTLTGDATVSLTGAYDGQRCMLEVTQDSTGGRALNASPQIRVGSDVAWAISTAPNTRTRIGLIYQGPTTVYDLVAVARGFAV